MPAMTVADHTPPPARDVTMRASWGLECRDGAVIYERSMTSASATADRTAPGTGQAPSDYLLCIEGERSWTVPLPASGELIIGRGAEAGLQLSDDQVSRAHAQLMGVPGGIRLRDLGSRHGTLINGHPLTAPPGCPRRQMHALP